MANGKPAEEAANASATGASSMSVDDIRPRELTRMQQEAYARDIAKLQAKVSGFVNVPCPACESCASSPAFAKFGFQFRRCQECRTLYMSPRPTPEIMASYYDDSENFKIWARHIFPASEAKRREKIHRPMLDYVVAACGRLGVPRGVLVEVGPGFGTFVALAQETRSFRKVLAVERNPEMAQACRDRGVTVLERPIEQVESTELGSADVLVSLEVIEHLFDPGAFLRNAARVLRPGGLLVLSCPNGEGFDTAILGAESVQVDSEHVNLFNPDSLALLLKNSGFDVLERTTPGRLDAELVRDAALAGKSDLSGNAFLKRVLLDDWQTLGGPFQAFLAANLLSGHLRILARKR